MVEAEGDVTAEAAEADEHVVGAGDALLGLAHHVGVSVALGILGHGVDKLAGGGAVFIHLGDVGAEFHFLVDHAHGEIKLHLVLRVDDFEGELVGAFVGGHEDVVAVGRHLLAVDTPAIAFAGEGRVERQLGHALDDVRIVDAEIHHGDFLGAGGGERG